MGYEGPRGGGDHEFMVKGKHKVKIPNPHGGQKLHVSGLSRFLLAAGFSEDEWMG